MGARRNSRPSLSLLLAAFALTTLCSHQVLGGGPRLALARDDSPRLGRTRVGKESFDRRALAAVKALGIPSKQSALLKRARLYTAAPDVTKNLKGLSQHRIRPPQQLPYQRYPSGTRAAPHSAATSLPARRREASHARRHDLTKKSRAALGEISVYTSRKNTEPVQSQVPPEPTGQARRRNQFRVPLHEGRFGIEQITAGSKIIYNRPHYGRFYSTRFRHGLEERRGRVVHHKTACLFPFDGLLRGRCGCRLG